MTTKFFATTCEFTLHEDDYSKGELKLISRWDEAPGMSRKDSVEELLKSVNYLDCDAFDGPVEFENDPCSDGEGSRFDADITVEVDDKGYDMLIKKPTPEMIEDWKAGKKMLYALHISIYVAKEVPLAEGDPEAKDYQIERK